MPRLLACMFNAVLQYVLSTNNKNAHTHNAVSQNILSESVAVTKEVLCSNTTLNGVETKIYIQRFDHVSFEETHFESKCVSSKDAVTRHVCRRA